MQTVFGSPECEWVDCAGPAEQELEALAIKYSLPSTLLQDCLDARHLPKFESLGDFDFLILRVFDERAAYDADSIQELTRKVAVIVSPTRLITIHRADFDFMKHLRSRWGQNKLTSDSLQQILIQIYKYTAASFGPAIDESLNQLDLLEMGLFGAKGGQRYSHEKGYCLKRRSFVFQRMIKALALQLPLIKTTSRHLKSQIKEVEDLSEKLLFDSDQLGESITTLMNMSLSMASNRTNDVMRVLTIFSMFLLPLNVVTGIYGMNFETMPELKHPLGYPFALLLMLLLEIMVFIWFKRRGWLERP